MIILNYLNKLLIYLQNDNIPNEGRLALAVFILSTVLLISFTNIIIYFLILIGIEKKSMKNKINQ
jgi:hypothetical protein